MFFMLSCTRQRQKCIMPPNLKSQSICKHILFYVSIIVHDWICCYVAQDNMKFFEKDEIWLLSYILSKIFGCQQNRKVMQGMH